MEITCPNCGSEWELGEVEAHRSKFECAECKHVFPLKAASETQVGSFHDITTRYVITDNGVQRGPFIRSQLDSMWKLGQITADATYWVQGMDEERSILELLVATNSSTSVASTFSLGASTPPPREEEDFAILHASLQVIRQPTSEAVAPADDTALSYEIKGDVSIGREADNVIVLTDDSISGHHAEIVRRDGKYILRDLNSENGIRVNGRMITEVELHDGDTISPGRAQCLFTLKSKPEAVQIPPPARILPQSIQREVDSIPTVLNNKTSPILLIAAACIIAGIAALIIISSVYFASPASISEGSPSAEAVYEPTKSVPASTPVRADPINIVPDASIDERLFLLRLLNEINSSWPDENLDSDKLQQALAHLRNETDRIERYLKDKALDDRLDQTYVMLLSTIDSYTDYLANMGRVERDSVAIKEQDSAASGVTAIGTGVETGYSLSQNGESTRDSLIGGGLMALGSYLLNNYQAGVQQDEAKEQASEEARSHIKAIEASYITFCQQTASVLSAKYSWKEGEAGFDESQEYYATRSQLIQNSDAAGLAQLEEPFMTKRPRDPFLMCNEALLGSYDPTESVDEKVANAKSCIRAASLVPAGSFYDGYRTEFLEDAGDILNRTSSQEIGNNAWSTAFNKNAALAVQVWSACLTFTTDVTGEIRGRKAWALVQSGDMDGACEQVRAVRELQKDNPAFAYNMACLASDINQLDSSLGWLDHAIRDLQSINIPETKIDPDLANLRAGKPSEFAALTTTTVVFKVDRGIIWDDLDIINTSPFPLTHVLVKGNVTSDGDTFPIQQAADSIAPRGTCVLSNFRLHSKTRPDTSGLQITCDQNK